MRVMNVGNLLSPLGPQLVLLEISSLQYEQTFSDYSQRSTYVAEL